MSKKTYTIWRKMPRAKMLRESEGVIRCGAIPPSLYEDVPKNCYGSSWKHSSKARKSWAK